MNADKTNGTCNQPHSPEFQPCPKINIKPHPPEPNVLYHERDFEGQRSFRPQSCLLELYRLFQNSNDPSKIDTPLQIMAVVNAFLESGRYYLRGEALVDRFFIESFSTYARVPRIAKPPCLSLKDTHLRVMLTVKTGIYLPASSAREHPGIVRSKSAVNGSERSFKLAPTARALE